MIHDAGSLKAAPRLKKRPMTGQVQGDDSPAAFIARRSSQATTPSASTLPLQISTSQLMRCQSGFGSPLGTGLLSCGAISDTHPRH